MSKWLARILAVAWAGFWLWFGVGWAVLERLPWYRIALSFFQPGLIFAAVVCVAWLWPRAGGVLLILTGFVLASWYAVSFGDRPAAQKLFVLSTFALPPLVAGLLLLISPLPPRPSAAHCPPAGC